MTSLQVCMEGETLVHDQPMNPGMNAWTVTCRHLEMVNAQLSHALPLGAVNGVSGEGGVSISSGCPYYPSCPTRNWYMTCLPILTRRDRRNGMSSSDSAPRVSETSGTLTWLHETVLPQADAPVGGHTRVLRTRGDDTRPPLPSWKESLRRHACMTQSLQRKQHT